MTTVWTILIVAVGLLVLAYVAGLILPRRHKSRHHVDLPRSVQDTWGIITDYPGQVAWHPDIEEVERLGEDGAWHKWREHHSRGETNLVRKVDADPPHSIVWRFEEEHGLFVAEWHAELIEHTGGTRLHITQYTDLKNPLARALAVFVFRRDSALKLYLDSLATSLQAQEGVK